MLDDIDYHMNNSNYMKSEGIIDFDDGHFIGASLGYEYSPYRMAAEISYTENTVNTFYTQRGIGKMSQNFDGNMNALSATGNIYYDFHIFTKASPYLGIGIGSANVEIEGKDQQGYFFNESTTVFARQCTGGLLIHLAENMAIDLSYRYFSTNDFVLKRKIDGVQERFKMNYETNLLLAGLKFSY